MSSFRSSIGLRDSQGLMSGSMASELLERAMRLAATAHRNQTRKGSDLPYISHPASVAVLLARNGFDESVIAASLLHDVVEDTDIQLEDLSKQFPKSIVDCVECLSEKKHDETGRIRPWRKRKEEHLRQIADWDERTRAVLLADKLHNLISMNFDLSENQDDFWSRFNASPADLIWYHESIVAAAIAGVDETVSPRLNMMASECQSLIEQLKEDLRAKRSSAAD